MISLARWNDATHAASSSRLEVKHESARYRRGRQDQRWPASTLRFYEEKGLLASIGRRGLRRLFEPSVLQTLSLIALGRSAGFSLDEIAGMFCADGEIRIERGRLASKADEIDLTIRRLSALRDGLRHAADCPAPNHLKCPTFRRLMGAAAARQGGDRSRRQTVRVRTARRS